MIQQEFDEWAEDFAAFHARFALLFLRSESREQMRRSLPVRSVVLRGLLSSVERKNGWQIAEAVGNALPDPRNGCCIALNGSRTPPVTACKPFSRRSSATPKGSASWTRPVF